MLEIRESGRGGGRDCNLHGGLTPIREPVQEGSRSCGNCTRGTCKAPFKSQRGALVSVGAESSLSLELQAV